MAKKFNIHDWQSKHIFEQDDRSEKDKEFDRAQAMDKLTPDDQDKLGKIQQMMGKEKSDRTLDYKGGAVLGPKIATILPEDYSIRNFAKDIGSVIEVEYGKHNIKAFLDELEDYFSIYSDDERSLGEEIDEQNVTSTGASFSAGNSPAYATPKAFGKKKNKNELKVPYRKSGYMGYSEPVKKTK